MGKFLFKKGKNTELKRGRQGVKSEKAVGQLTGQYSSTDSIGVRQTGTQGRGGRIIYMRVLGGSLLSHIEEGFSKIGSRRSPRRDKLKLREEIHVPGGHPCRS